jgi:hypothetical protein
MDMWRGILAAMLVLAVDASTVDAWAQPTPRPVPHVVPGSAMRLPPGRWYDGAHGHNRIYPAPGYIVRRAPPRSSVIVWGGVNYRFYDGVWVAPGPAGYAVVRPPFGVVLHDLPPFHTAVVIGGLTYLYLNGVYYRALPQGGYEVMPPPGDAGAAQTDRLYVYPARGQSAEQQASDEYECHRWAVGQTGFDPTAAATGQPGGDTSRRADYRRAIGACLEGRGYTVR